MDTENQPMEKEIPALETIIFMLSCETLGAIKIEIWDQISPTKIAPGCSHQWKKPTIPSLS